MPFFKLLSSLKFRSCGALLKPRSISKNLKTMSLNSQSNETVLREKHNNIMMIGINRPEKKNAVNLATALKLKEAFEEFEKDSEASVAVLHGIGGSFCSGFDLSEVATTDVEIDVESLLLNEMSFMGPTRMLTSKPVIAAISGYAVAGGLELALLCDLRVVEETAVMGVFCRRFGVPLIDGGTTRLPKLIGLSRALDLILTGRHVEGTEALQMGLANRLVSCGTALGQALNLAISIAKFPQKCLQADRKSTYYSTFTASSMNDALEFELRNGVSVIKEEGKAGAQKFKTGIGKHGSFNLNKPKL